MMTSIARLVFAGILTCCMSLATAADPKQGVRKVPGSYLCGQVDMRGNAGGSYGNMQACNTAKPQLQTDAITNGNDQCKSFCTSLGCREETVPQTLRATAVCKGPDPANQKWYGKADTGQFNCKCLNP